MWPPTTHAQHSRAGLRYGSDVTDAEWLILALFLPLPSCRGCPQKWEMREIVNSIFYVLCGGIAWTLLPKDFPPVSSAYRWFARFRDDGTWRRINYYLVMLDSEREGPDVSPAAALIDSRSVKTTEIGGISGFDIGRKIKGCKRHAMVDTDGQALKLRAHSADIQGRDGADPLLRASRRSWPFVALGYADGGRGVPLRRVQRHPATKIGSMNNRFGTDFKLAMPCFNSVIAAFFHAEVGIVSRPSLTVNDGQVRQ